MKKKLLIFLLFMCSLSMIGQQYPVQLLINIQAPAPVNLYNYADDTSLNSPITVQIFLNDLTISNRQIKLKTYFEGGSIQFQSKDFVLGAENLFIDGGIPLMLRNTELAPYYKYENIQGIGSATYGQSIPEGSYDFCFEVFDYLTGSKLSAKKCAKVFIFKNEPPLLNLPFNGTNIEPKDFENIVFQWTPRHLNVSNVEYELSIVEIWDNNVSPQTAFLSQIPIYQETTRATSLLYGADKPQLLPDKRYAWRVQAKALQGLEEIGLFKNEGYSEVFWFSRTSPCQAPEGISAEPKGLTKINVYWNEDSIEYSDYIIAYREANKSDAYWFTKKTNSAWATIWNLKPGTTYEYKVKGKCTYQYSEYSEIQYVTTDIVTNEDANYQCGIVPDEIAITNREPHPGLIAGSQITAGDFKVVITEITSQSPGAISGSGYVSIPYLNFVKFAVNFNSILVNTDNQLAQGEIVTVYDAKFGEGASMTIDVNVNISEGINGDAGDTKVEEVDFVIDSVTINADGAIVVTGINAEGEPDSAIIPGDKDVKIISSNGDVWSVGEDGTVTTTKGAEGGAVIAESTNGIDADGQVTQITAKGVLVKFEKSGYYSYDALPQNTSPELAAEYKSIDAPGEKYEIPYKALSDNNGEDFIYADVQITDNAIVKDSIVFKTKEGAKVDILSWNGNKAKLKLARKFHYADEDIYATIKNKEGKYDIAGALITTHLASEELEAINVVLVPVGAKIKDGLIAKTKEIYAKAGVRLNIEIKEEVDLAEISDWDLDKNNRLEVGDSSILSHYTNEEKAFNTYVKNQTYYNKKTYYVFITNVSVSKDIDGFMPLKRQFGFVFTAKANTIDKQTKTLAHELGHGIFGLEHTWDEYKLSKGATDFLMDNGSGTVLNHLDWKKMHAPGMQLYWFQGDEDGEQISTNSLSKFEVFGNKDSEGKLISYSFISPSQEVVTIPKDVSKVVFATLDPYFYKAESNNSRSGDYAPVGSLLRFEWKKSLYTFKGKGGVYAYRNENDVKYKDVLTKNIKEQEAIIALPIYDFDEEKIKLSVNKHVVDDNQIKEGDFDVFNQISENFCVVEEYNNSQNFDYRKLSGLFRNNVIIEDVSHNKLTPFAKEYLNLFSPKNNTSADTWSLTFFQKEFSPVIVSAALAYASNEAIESFIQCHLIDAINEEDKSRRDINSAPYSTTGWSLLFTFRTAIKQRIPEALMRSYLDYYLNDLRELIKLPQKIEEIQSELSTDKLSALTSKELVPLVMISSNCTLEQMNFEDRVEVIKKILKKDNSYFNDNEEDALIKLINSTVFNNQSEQLITELFNTENSKLFADLWKDLNFSEYHEFINKITELITLEGVASEVKDENRFSFSTSDKNLFDYSLDEGKVVISYLSTSNFKTETKTFNSLNEIVEITIPKEDSFIKWNDSELTEDKVLKLPAYYIAYLLQKKKTDDNMFAARVIGNAIAILATVPTGGASLTAGAAITLALSSTDIIMAFSEDYIKTLDGGKEFVKAWEIITLIDGVNGLTRAGINITKNLGKKIISIDLTKFKANIRSLKNTSNNAFDEIRKIPALLVKMKQLPSEIIFNRRLVLEIEQVIFSEKFISSIGKKLNFKDGIQGLIDDVNVFNIELASTGGFLKFKLLKNSFNSTDSFLGKIEDVRYANGSKIEEGTFLLFKNTEGAIYAVKDINYFIPDLLKGARNNVRNVYGGEYVDIFLKQKFKGDQGAAAVIIDKFGAAGKKILDNADIKSLDDAAKAIVKDKEIMRFYSEHMDKAYRAVNETSFNFDKLKSTGIVDASPAAFPTYISLDNFTNANVAKDVLQLPKKPTWVAEFTIDQVVADIRFAKGKFNKGDYTEVLTQAFPNWGKGGGTQFLTNAKIKISSLKNLVTGEVLKFTHLVYKTNFAKHLKEVDAFSQRRAVTGGHNLSYFNNYLRNNNIEINILNTRNGSVDGISELTYQIQKADGSGGWKTTQFKKTLYDPSKLSDLDMIKWGKEAMDEGILSNRITIQAGSNTIIKGESSNGIKFLGYRNPVNGEINNFHPVINY